MSEKTDRGKLGSKGSCKDRALSNCQQKKKPLNPSHNINRLRRDPQNILRSPYGKVPKNHDKNDPETGECRSAKKNAFSSNKQQKGRLTKLNKKEQEPFRLKKQKKNSKNGKSKSKKRLRLKTMEDFESKEVETTKMETVKIHSPLFQSNDCLPTSDQGFKIIQRCQSSRKLGGRLKPKVKDPFGRRIKLDNQLNKVEIVENIGSGVSLGETEAEQYNNFIQYF